MKHKSITFALVVLGVMINFILTPWYSELHRNVQLTIVLFSLGTVAIGVTILGSRLYLRIDRKE